MRSIPRKIRPATLSANYQATSHPTTPTDQAFYGPRCRLLSEFLSPAFLAAEAAESAEGDSASGADSGDGIVGGGGGGGGGGIAGGVASLFPMLEATLDEDLMLRVAPFSTLLAGASSDVFRASPSASEPRLLLSSSAEGTAAVPNTEGEWSRTEAALITATAGLTRFCLATIDESFSNDFGGLLNAYFR